MEMTDLTPQTSDNGNSDKKLIMLSGLPRSGKSTWAKKQGYPVVSPDAIRLAKTGRRWWSPIEHEVWATALTMVRALFLAGHDIVIVDTTSCTRRSRDNFKPPKDVFWQRWVKYIDTPIEVCIERAINSGQADLVEVIENQYVNSESISRDEHISSWRI